MRLLNPLSLVFPGFAIATAAATTATFANSVSYKFDNKGTAIDSTSGKIDFLAGEYVWYGIDLSCGSSFCGILSWSSSDLQNWHPNGYLFDPNTTEIQSLCGGELTGNCGRPHIVYSNSTKTYVLWVNANSPGYAIFTSSNPTSGYVLSPNRALLGYDPFPGPYQAGDFSVAVIDGQGYVAYSLIDFTTTGASIWPPFLQSIYLQPLNAALTNTTGNVSHVVSAAGDLVDFEAESPDIFKRGKYFYVVASNTCGFCTGTLLVVYRSTSISGPWTRQIISADTCGGQVTGVLTLPSPSSASTSSYLLQSDQVSTAPLSGIRTTTHGYNFQTLSFNPDGSVADLNCATSATFTVSFNTGSTAYPSFSPSENSGNIAPYQGVCNLPTYELYQTFVASKTGTLNQFGVNIAADTPTGPLSLTLFRYSNNSALLTPRYVWETLTTASIPAASLATFFDQVLVSSNATVKQGDKLGIAVTTSSVTPICVLKTGGSGVTSFPVGTNVAGDRVLFANGGGQVSLRGPQGKNAPVVALDGQIKWFANIQ